MVKEGERETRVGTIYDLNFDHDHDHHIAFKKADHNLRPRFSTVNDIDDITTRP